MNLSQGSSWTSNISISLLMALNSKHTPKAMARGYAIVTQFPVSAQDTSIHQMLHGVTMLTETASSLATISIRLTAGAQTTSLNYLSIS
jgi:hypothetical protein